MCGVPIRMRVRGMKLDEQGLRTADEVDAYVLARIALVVALRRAGREVKLLQYEAEALKKLREVA